MKKLLLLVLVSLCMVLSVEPVEASYYFYDGFDPEHKKEDAAYLKRWNAFNDKAEILVKDVRKLADQIATFNKPVFESQLTKEERKYYEMGDDIGSTSPILWNRIYAKNKTCVFGRAGKDKKFKAAFFATTDPRICFLGKVHVGMTTKELERFFNDSMSNIANKDNTRIVAPQIDGTDAYFATVFLHCKNGIVTEISADFTDNENVLVFSKKAVNFAKKQFKQMGLSTTDGYYFWYD